MDRRLLALLMMIWGLPDDMTMVELRGKICAVRGQKGGAL